MNAADKYDVVVLGSGTGGKLMHGPWPRGIRKPDKERIT
jgi:hypothetical protein